MGIAIHRLAIDLRLCICGKRDTKWWISYRENGINYIDLRQGYKVRVKQLQTGYSRNTQLFFVFNLTARKGLNL